VNFSYLSIATPFNS